MNKNTITSENPTYYYGFTSGTTYPTYSFTYSACGFEDKCSDYPLRCSSCKRKKTSYYIPKETGYTITCKY